MKVEKFIKSICFILLCCVAFSLSISAQDGDETIKVRDRIAKATTETGEDKAVKTDDGQDQTNTSDDETVTDNTKDVEAYYLGYMKTYRLGPTDVISVRVFGQCPDYCREDLTIPPTARISYPLIRGGIFVLGKSIQQLEAEITKKLDEYIIDPDVTIELVKVGSARYNVLGRVASPGEHLMDREITIFDAIAASGGIAEKGDRKKILILRPNRENKLDPILVNLKDIEESRAEMAILKPGDQVYVPKQGFKLGDIPEIVGKVSVFRFLFGSPF